MADTQGKSKGIPARWDRVVLKVSGEAFAGSDGFGIDGAVVSQIAGEIVAVRDEFDVDIAVVASRACGWDDESLQRVVSPPVA